MLQHEGRLERHGVSFLQHKADASFPSDREQIRRQVVRSGGFSVLDTAVRELLRKLFMESMAAAFTATRNALVEQAH